VLCKPPKPQSSEDKRKVAVRQYHAGINKAVIAKSFEVTEECIRKWVVRHRDTGEYGRKPRGWSHRFKLTQKAIGCIKKILEQDPAAYWDEVQIRLWARTHERASRSTVARIGRKMGYTDKVAGNHTHRRNPALMQLHARQRDLYDPRAMIFVDEAHKRGRDMRRKRAKARSGKQPYIQMSPHLARAWTVLCGMNYLGVVGQSIVELGPDTGLPQAVDRRRFMLMFREKILPHLNPFINDGVLRLNSVVVIDNCSLHHSEFAELRHLCDNLPGAGVAKLIYTPPYWCGNPCHTCPSR
jgi:transposase